MLGVALVWIVLFIGDLAGEGGEGEGEGGEGGDGGSGGAAEPRITLLSRQHTNFVSVARKKAAKCVRRSRSL